MQQSSCSSLVRLLLGRLCWGPWEIPIVGGQEERGGFQCLCTEVQGDPGSAQKRGNSSYLKIRLGQAAAGVISGVSEGRKAAPTLLNSLVEGLFLREHGAPCCAGKGEGKLRVELRPIAAFVRRMQEDICLLLLFLVVLFFCICPSPGTATQDSEPLCSEAVSGHMGSNVLIPA